MDLAATKTTLPSLVPPISVNTSSLMMSPPSEPELTPKEVVKTSQPNPEGVVPMGKPLEVEDGKKADDQLNAGNDSTLKDDHFYDCEEDLIIDIPEDLSAGKPELSRRQIKEECKESPATAVNNGDISPTETQQVEWSGYGLLHLLAEAAEIRSNSEKNSDQSTTDTSPESGPTSSRSSMSSTTTPPSSGHSTISAMSVASSIVSARPKVSRKRSLEYPVEG